MNSAPFPQTLYSVARCRLLLSVFALVAVFVDPTEPTLTRWIPLTGGAFSIDSYTLGVMGLHWCYSSAVLWLLYSERASSARLDGFTLWMDVLFGGAIAAVTEGATSPFYAFFAFAVLEAGMIGGIRRAMIVTGASAALYLSLIVLSAHGNLNLYIMRPIYLGITGYLVGYIGQQRLNLEAGIRELAANNQRQQIARDLHDSRAQVLAGVTLRLETAQELLRRGRGADARAELADLQKDVNQEYQDFRAYMRSLVGMETTPASREQDDRTAFSVSTRFSGSGQLAHHVLHILNEGITNIVRHAHAHSAEIRVEEIKGKVQITMKDDGVGFHGSEQRPWSILSRVQQCGGTLLVVQNGRRGAHLAITLPQS